MTAPRMTDGELPAAPAGVGVRKAEATSTA